MSETTKSLDFNLALKVVSCTLLSASSTSRVSWVSHFTYGLRVSFSPCLIVSKWSAGLFERCLLMKWRKKALFNCLKLLTDDFGNFVNHSLAAPLRVVGKERHSISSGGCWRPRVVLQVLRRSRGSLSPSNSFSWGNRNLDGTGHSRIAVVKGESVVLTILSKLWSVCPLMAFLSSSISFFISRRRFMWGSFGVVGSRQSLLLRLSPSSPWLALDRFSSCWSRSFISWFYLVSSSTMAVRAWTCWTRVAKSWLDSIWMWKLIGNYAFDPKYENVAPTDGAKLMKRGFVSWVVCVKMDPNSRLDDYVNEKIAPLRWLSVWCMP